MVERSAAEGNSHRPFVRQPGFRSLPPAPVAQQAPSSKSPYEQVNKITAPSFLFTPSYSACPYCRRRAEKGAIDGPVLE